MAACNENRLDVARYLIEKGANIDYQNVVIIISIVVVIVPVVHYVLLPTQSGLTSLHCACDEGHTAVVQLLIESHAKLDIKDNVSIELL
jgi:ankyrin repeat protein